MIRFCSLGSGSSFVVPAACYAVLFLFSMAAHRARTSISDEPAVATIH